MLDIEGETERYKRLEENNNRVLEPFFNFFRKIFSSEEEIEESVIEEVDDTALVVDDAYIGRFESHSLQDFDSLKGRDESVELLTKAYESWKDTNNPLLLVSEAGMGSSSLLHSTIKLYPTAQILEDTVNFYSRRQLISILQNSLGIEGDFQNLEELSKQVTEERVVIFENIERLFLRKVGGFNLLDDFILFVHATKAKVYWILTINRYSFYYLDRVRDFSSNFSSIIYLKPVSNELITNIIAERNQGFSVNYLAPKSLQLPANFREKTKEDKQDFLRKEYNKKLLGFAEGNISRALLFWRMSVRRAQEKTVYLRAFEPKELTDLTLEETLILEAILQHNSLSTEELREVFRNSSKGSKLAIEKLLEKNAIIFKEYHNSAKEEYQINPLYMPVVKKLLRNRLNRNIV